MKFSLSWEDANKLVRFAKAYCLKKDGRPLFKLVACRITNDHLTATALDGYKACRIVIPVSYVEGDTDTDFFIAPSTKSFKRSDGLVTVKDAPTQTEYETATGATRYRKPDFADGKPFDVASLLKKELKFSVWFDPVMLATALSAFEGSRAVRLDLLGEEEGVYVSDKDTMAIVMPVHPPKDNE